MVVECVATVALAAIAVPSVVAGLEYNDRTVTSRFDDGDQHGVPVEALEHKPPKEQAGRTARSARSMKRAQRVHAHDISPWDNYRWC